MIRMLLAALALFIAFPATAQDVAAARTGVEAAMRDSAEGWNQGSVDRFLAIYSEDSATSFVTAKGVVRGKGAIRDKYIASYPALFGPAAGGTPPRLSFTFEDFRLLGPDHALLIAQWRLDTPGAETATGWTSLVFRKEKGGWKIVADHSS